MFQIVMTDTTTRRKNLDLTGEERLETKTQDLLTLINPSLCSPEYITKGYRTVLKYVLVHVLENLHKKLS